MLEKQSKPIGSILVTVLAAFVSVILLYFLYRDLDFAAFWQELKKAKGSYLTILVASILLEQCLRAWKWQQLLYNLKAISVKRFFMAIMAGYAVTIIVPLGVSPLVRSWLIARLENLKFATVLISAVLERFIDGVVFGLLVAGFALLGIIPKIEGGLRSGITVAGIGSLIFFVGLLLLLFRLKLELAKPKSFVTRFLSWISKRIPNLSDLPGALTEGIVYPQSHWRKGSILLAALCIKLIALSHFAWAGFAVGVSLSFNDYLFLFIFVSFAFILSRFVRVPGGFVIAAAFALNLLGVAEEQALAMIVLLTMLSLLTTLSVGFICLYSSGLSLRDIRLARALK